MEQPTGHPRARHNPTPDEIREACREIRDGWTADQEQVRRAVRNPEATTERPSVVHWNGHFTGIDG